MKKKELEKLRSKTKEELTEDMQNYKERLWNLQVDLRSGKVKNVREIRQLKRTIAAIYTLLKNLGAVKHE